MSDTATLTRPSHTNSDGDGDLIAHVCLADDIARAAVTGEEIVALCGTRWVPCRDPENVPLCQECLTIVGDLGYERSQARLRELNGRPPKGDA